jgi:hypothetical protein
MSKPLRLIAEVGFSELYPIILLARSGIYFPA